MSYGKRREGLNTSQNQALDRALEKLQDAIGDYWQAAQNSKAAKKQISEFDVHDWQRNQVLNNIVDELQITEENKKLLEAKKELSLLLKELPSSAAQDVVKELKSHYKPGESFGKLREPLLNKIIFNDLVDEINNRTFASIKIQLENHFKNRNYNEALNLLEKNKDLRQGNVRLIDSELNLSNPVSLFSTDPTSPLVLFARAGQFDAVNSLIELEVSLLPGKHGNNDAVHATLLYASEHKDKIDDCRQLIETLGKAHPTLIEQNYTEVAKLNLPKLTNQYVYAKELKEINANLLNYQNEPSTNPKKRALEEIKSTIENGGTRKEISALIDAKRKDDVVTAGVFKHRVRDLLDTLKKSDALNQKEEQNSPYTYKGPY